MPIRDDIANILDGCYLEAGISVLPRNYGKGKTTYESLRERLTMISSCPGGGHLLQISWKLKSQHANHSGVMVWSYGDS